MTVQIADDNGGEETVAEAEEKQDTKVEEPKREIPKFSELLKNKEFVSEFDSRVGKAIETAVGNARKEWEEEENLTAEEKAKKALERREQELKTREEELQFREDLAEVKGLLNDNRLPNEFAEIIVRGTEGSDQYQDVVDALKSTWDKELAEQLKIGARQEEPKAANNAKGSKKPRSFAELAKENRKI